MLPDFVKIGQTVEEISRFFVIFTIAAAAILVFEKFEILTVCPLYPCRGPICFTVPNFSKIGQTVAKIW